MRLAVGGVTCTSTTSCLTNTGNTTESEPWLASTNPVPSATATTSPVGLTCTGPRSTALYAMAASGIVSPVANSTAARSCSSAPSAFSTGVVDGGTIRAGRGWSAISTVAVWPVAGTTVPWPVNRTSSPNRSSTKTASVEPTTSGSTSSRSRRSRPPAATVTAVSATVVFPCRTRILTRSTRSNAVDGPAVASASGTSETAIGTGSAGAGSVKKSLQARRDRTDRRIEPIRCRGKRREVVILRQHPWLVGAAATLQGRQWSPLSRRDGCAGASRCALRQLQATVTWNAPRRAPLGTPVRGAGGRTDESRNRRMPDGRSNGAADTRPPWPQSAPPGTLAGLRRDFPKHAAGSASRGGHAGKAP